MIVFRATSNDFKDVVLLMQESAWLDPKRNIMAIDGGQRNCGVHELICARKVSPEVLGFLITIAVFSFLVILFFLYVSKKLSINSSNQASYLDSQLRNNKDYKASRTASGCHLHKTPILYPWFP
ncbi:uncharacterized protein [Paramormyrops kingsleyae]|uniref:uncharacterized protein n=1 Tax=Paramormyrops kingsleyae TaxID=1676925 RepID=UPI003B9788DD